MTTMHLYPYLRRSANRRARGQILVMFPAAFIVLVLLATLTLDGAFMQQSQRDLEIVATHAATVGATDINRDYYNTQCAAYVVAHTYYMDPTNTFVVAAGTPGAISHTPTATDCNQFLTLDTATASADATASANTWLAQVTSATLNLPGGMPAPGTPAVSVAFGAGPVGGTSKTITVTVRYCYKPMVLSGFWNEPRCLDHHSVLVAASYTSDPLAGQ
jgi:hypothetical protein